VWISGIECRNHLVIVTARLAVAQELHLLDLDLGGVRLRFQLIDHLGNELIQWHREITVLLAG
jgi:hypothetical protein